jgi:hypothetical protein
VIEKTKYTSPPSSLEVFSSEEGVSYDPFTLSMFLDINFFLKCPSFPHIHHTFTKFSGDLDLPLYLDIPLEHLDIFLS